METLNPNPNPWKMQISSRTGERTTKQSTDLHVISVRVHTGSVCVCLVWGERHYYSNRHYRKNILQKAFLPPLISRTGFLDHCPSDFGTGASFVVGSDPYIGIVRYLAASLASTH